MGFVLGDCGRHHISDIYMKARAANGCHVKTVGGVENVMRLDNPAPVPHQPPGLLSWSASLGNNERGTQGRHAGQQPCCGLRLGWRERARLCVCVVDSAAD